VSRLSEIKIRVRYAETDQMGVVYHANHFVWFEVGRVEFLRQLGFSYKDMERQDGCHIHNMYLFQVKTPAESNGP